MATYTPNYNLKKPALNDKIRIADFNGNADIIDGAMNDNATLIAQLKSDIGIVENTNTATHNISAGQYVIWKGSLYTASSAISSGATLSDANLTAVSGGGLNALNSNLSSQTGGVPIRKAGVISAGNSISFVISNNFSSSEGYALVSLNIVGNSLAGSALLYLGRGTGKKKDLIGSMEESTYTATYSNNGTWTITNNTSDNLYYTAIISK